MISSVTVKTLERNIILHEKCSNILNDLPSIARNSEHEKVDCVRKARISWEQGINEELLAIAQESKRPFLMIRFVYYIRILNILYTIVFLLKYNIIHYIALCTILYYIIYSTI